MKASTLSQPSHLLIKHLLSEADEKDSMKFSMTLNPELLFANHKSMNQDNLNYIKKMLSQCTDGKRYTQIPQYIKSSSSLHKKNKSNLNFPVSPDQLDKT